MAKPVFVRTVYRSNVEKEIRLIDSVLPNYPIVSFDTEFPGIVLDPGKPFHQLQNDEIYISMKNNVNASKIIQLGLTLSDPEGNLPDFGSDYCFIWEFNFREFDDEVDAQNPTSIQLLKSQGIDFHKNKTAGIDVRHFAQLFLASGLGVSARSFFGHGGEFPTITWVLFHSIYDLGYLIKILMHKDLPDDQFTFALLVYVYLGFSVFDVKEIATHLGLHGGLEKIAQNLGVSREAGKSHQAGSDSLLTMQAFLKLQEKYFSGENSNLIDHFNHKLYGLEADFSDVRKALSKMRWRMKSSTAADNRTKFFPTFARHRPVVPFPTCAIPRDHPAIRGYPLIRRFRMVPMGAIAPVPLY